MRPAFRLILAAAIAIVLASGIRRSHPRSTRGRTCSRLRPLPTARHLTEIPERDITMYSAQGGPRPSAERDHGTLPLGAQPEEGDPAKDREEFTVEMEAARGGPVARTKVVIPARPGSACGLPKPAAPPAPAAALPTAGRRCR